MRYLYGREGSLLSAFFSVVLAMGVLVLIGYPLFKGYRGEGYPELKPARPSLASQKETVMNALGEIEFDYHMKKLSEEDYQQLKNTYAGAAVNILRAQDRTVDTMLKAKGKKAGFTTADIEQEIERELASLSAAEETAGKCHRCGAVLKEIGQEYCHACGERQF